MKPIYMKRLSVIILFLLVLAFGGRATALVLIKYHCGPDYDCWTTTTCTPEVESRTVSRNIRYCFYSGVEYDTCIQTGWLCFLVYACPDGEFLGSVYTPDVCYY